MDVLIEQVAAHLGWVILGVCFIVATVVKGITTIVTSGAREKSRREIAAYIAEGTMSAEQGQQLLSGDRRRLEA